MAISSIGVGSGLPLDELLSDLRKSENQALKVIENRQAQAENRLSAYGVLKSALTSLETTAKALGKAETYGAVKANVSGDAFTATANSKAISGEYAIHVERLATSQTLVTEGFGSRNDANGDGGSLTFTLADGSTKSLDLSETGTSLNDIVKAINADSELGVKATIINDGNPDNPHRLLLTASKTGEEAAISSIQVDDNSSLAAKLGFDKANPLPGQTIQEEAAVNAEIKINGIVIQSQSNTIEDAIEGVTLQLEKASEGTANKLSITDDNSVTEKAIKDFVQAYNTLNSSIRSLTSFDVDKQTSSALTGDSLARRLQNDVRNALNVVLNGNITTLGSLGVTANVKTGDLEIDEKKLSSAIGTHMNEVKDLFTGSTGISERIGQVAQTFNRSDGLFSITTDGINRSLTDIQRQYQAASDRIDNKMEAYRRQFSQLDALIAQMNSTSNYLAQQLSMLPNLNSGNR